MSGNTDSVAGIQVGDRVQCFVYVCGEAIPMHQGIVTELRDGYYMVDRMGLHGGRPWIVPERHVKKLDADPVVLQPGDDCPKCGMSLQYTCEGAAAQGEGFELWCPACHHME